MFERFHRVKTTQARTFEGTGIGLALVQELVKLHRGEIRVESSLGTGAPRGPGCRPSRHGESERAGGATSLTPGVPCRDIRSSARAEEHGANPRGPSGNAGRDYAGKKSSSSRFTSSGASSCIQCPGPSSRS